MGASVTIRIILISIFLILSSCATKVITKSESDKISMDMTSFNTRMSGFLFRKEMKGDMSALDIEKYLQLVKTQGNPSEIDYIDFILKDHPEVRVTAKKDDFVVCVKLAVKQFGICDKASTNFVDKYLESTELTLDLMEITKELNR
jgi:hypothetical protein